MKKPSLKIVSTGIPSAFMVGRRGSGTVATSREFIQLLDHDRFEGAVTHELAHIDNRDVITMQLGQGTTSMIAIAAQHIVLFTGDSDLADFFLAIVVGQIVQFLVMISVLTISRYREYIADVDTKRVIDPGDPPTRTPEKIQQKNQQARELVRTVRRSHGRTRCDRRHNMNVDQQVSALCISSSDRGFLQRIISTHPPMEKRIERFRS